MSIVFRIISGASGLAILAGTVVMALHLLDMERDLKVMLAGYMGIGGILLGGYLLFYALTGKTQPKPATRKD